MVKILRKNGLVGQLMVSFHFGDYFGKIFAGNKVDETSNQSYNLYVDGKYLGYFYFTPSTGVLYRGETISRDNKGLYFPSSVHSSIMEKYSMVMSVLPYVMYSVYDAFHPKGVSEIIKFEGIGSPYLLYIQGSYFLEYVDCGVLCYDLLPVVCGRLSVANIHIRNNRVYEYIRKYIVQDVVIPDFKYIFYGKSGILAVARVSAGKWYITVNGKDQSVSVKNGIAVAEGVPKKYLRFVENYMSYVKENKIVW